jgi:hypothetical protein
LAKEKAMSTTELKQILIEKIQLTDDLQLLEEAYRLLEINDDRSEVFVLTEAQHQAIETARQQIQAGQYLTHEQANKEIDEWLEK